MRRRAHKLASIIVPCWNQLRYTKECVRSILRCTSQPYELIFVDNGSTDGTPAFLRSLGGGPRVRVIRNEKNLGFGAAINQGMKAAEGDYLVWLNNDTVVTSRWLDKLIGHAESSPRVAAVGPVVNDEHPERQLRPDRFAAVMELSRAGKAHPAHLLVGFCLLLKRRAVDEVGLLDRRFGTAFFEDYDYCMRLRQAGYDLLVASDVYVHHHWHKSFADRAAFAKRFAASREVFIDKWCRFALEWLSRTPAPQVRDELWTRPVLK